jgi:hypothetical protein
VRGAHIPQHTQTHRHSTHNSIIKHFVNLLSANSKLLSGYHRSNLAACSFLQTRALRASPEMSSRDGTSQKAKKRHRSRTPDRGTEKRGDRHRSRSKERGDKKKSDRHRSRSNERGGDKKSDRQVITIIKVDDYCCSIYNTQDSFLKISS